MIKRLSRKCESLFNPFFGDCLVKDFDMPIRLVGQFVHDNHHCNLSYQKDFRLRSDAAGVNPHRVDFAVGILVIVTNIEA